MSIELREKDAEIERLKAEGPWQIIKCPYCEKEHSYKPSKLIRDYQLLITELADALDGPRFDAIHQRELVQRAREATK